MRDRVYGVVIDIFRASFRLLDIRFDIRGAEHLPVRGAAVVASNHTSYLDFTFIGLAAYGHDRKVRFMAKRSLFTLPVIGSLMRAMGHVPVDRSSGSGAYRHAERALTAGELVGVFPEATISRSWVLKPFKMGAAALAVNMEVPLVPVITWGGHRLVTVDGRRSFRRHTPVTVLIGAPISSHGRTPEEVNELLQAKMAEMLDDVQRHYPEQPSSFADLWWLPHHLGGTAPDPVTAAAIDAAKLAA